MGGISIFCFQCGWKVYLVYCHFHIGDGLGQGLIHFQRMISIQESVIRVSCKIESQCSI